MLVSTSVEGPAQQRLVPPGLLHRLPQLLEPTENCPDAALLDHRVPVPIAEPLTLNTERQHGLDLVERCGRNGRVVINQLAGVRWLVLAVAPPILLGQPKEL